MAAPATATLLAVRSPADGSAGVTSHAIHCLPRPEVLQRVAGAGGKGLVVPLVESSPPEETGDAVAALDRAPLGRIGVGVS